MSSTALQENIKTLTLEDEYYPQLLSKIYDPPKKLFVRGTLPSPDALCFAVVGSRLATPYGKQVTHEIVTKLARAGIVIVSGLALGIDGEAHRAALEVGGKTIAVLGSGIDQATLYPRAHRGLADRIVEAKGAVLAEYPPGTEPTRYTFPQRNRIIAGMSIGTLVVEAKESSGALITAQFAIDENREVFAMPGAVTNSTSYGPHMLIKRGAQMVTEAEDILEALGIQAAPQKAEPKLQGLEAQIFNALSREPIHIDKLIETTKLDISTLTATLAVIELKGLVKNVGGMNFIKVM